MPQWWESEIPPCSAHDHERLRPEVVAMPALAAPAISSPTTSTVIYPEAQVNKHFYHLIVIKVFLNLILLNF